MPTYVHARTASGSETVTDQLAGTALRKAGPSGRVRAAVAATLPGTTFLLKGRQSGIEVIPNGSRANVIGPVTAQSLGAQEFVFTGACQPGEDLELTIVHGAAGTALVAVTTD